METEKDSDVTAGSVIKALQEASEKICAEDYLRMKLTFILMHIGRMNGERGNNDC